jgi:molybdopterin synthase sulfur carrier subunit
MKLRILAFGIAKDILGTASMEKEWSDGLTMHDLRSQLEKEYPKLKELRTFMLALNSEYATGPEQVNDNDEIAIIPPVSGG